MAKYDAAGKMVYYQAADGTIENIDPVTGTRTTLYTDGSKTAIQANGTKTTTAVNGAITALAPDGAKVRAEP